ncbi:hypothetical protein JFV26_15530 [Pseudomonas sp. TH31]|nr:hypothetical protein [Pseudomonas sp. TH31]
MKFLAQGCINVADSIYRHAQALISFLLSRCDVSFAHKCWDQEGVFAERLCSKLKLVGVSTHDAMSRLDIGHGPPVSSCLLCARHERNMAVGFYFIAMIVD